MELGNGMIGGGLVYLESCRLKILLSFYRCICYLEYETAGNSLVCMNPPPLHEKICQWEMEKERGGREREREGGKGRGGERATERYVKDTETNRKVC